MSGERRCREGAQRFAAQVQLAHMKVPAAIVARILELSEALNELEVATHTGVPVHLVRLVLRGGGQNA